jgi:CheY-like chemotaxis protein
VGLTHVLRRTALTQQQNESLDKISVATSHLMSIINDILDLSKIEADRLVLESVDFNLKVLLDNVFSIFFEQANSKGVNLSVDPGSGPYWLNGDPTRIRQALLNFVSNAIKFTQAGTIQIRVQYVTTNDTGMLLRFEVTDTGIGIPPDRLARLFSAFEQADASTTRKYGGTGLGLAITKKLALLMGGDAGATSDAGMGSTFWFTAYLRPGVEAERMEAKSTLSDWEASLSRAAGKRILVADDLAVNRELIASLLEPSGLIIDLAFDGLDAVAKATAHDYEMILMDVQMPNLDGMGAARAIHALPGKNTIPIIAVTANVFVEDRLACKAAGMIDFLSKPVDPQMLYFVVAKWLGLPTQSPTEPLRERVFEKQIEPAPHSTIIDAARGLRTWGGNAAQYSKFLRKFAADYCSSDLGFEPMIEPPDLAKAVALAHKIKGAAANLAIVDVSNAAGALERALKGTQAATEELSVLKIALSRAAIEIAHLYPESMAPTLVSSLADRGETLNHNHLNADLTALLHALNADNPDGIEFLIDNLAAKLPIATLKPIKEAVDDFDFRRAEELVRQVEHGLT